LTIDDPEEIQESEQLCICLGDIDIDSTSTICSGVWNCFDSVVCLVFHFISDIWPSSSNYVIYINMCYLPKTVYNPVINNSTAIDIYMSHPKAICMNRDPAKILTYTLGEQKCAITEIIYDTNIV